MSDDLLDNDFTNALQSDDIIDEFTEMATNAGHEHEAY